MAVWGIKLCVIMSWIINSIINSHVLLTHATPVNVQIPNPSMQDALTLSLKYLMEKTGLNVAAAWCSRWGIITGQWFASQLRGRSISATRKEGFPYISCCLFQLVMCYGAAHLPGPCKKRLALHQCWDALASSETSTCLAASLEILLSGPWS